MAGKLPEGFDWLPAAATSSQINALLEAAGWFISGNSGLCTIVTPGAYGYGQALGFTGALAPGDSFYQAMRPIGTHNSAGGWVSAGVRLPVSPDHFPFIGVYDAVNAANLITVTFELNGVVRVYRGFSAKFGGVLLANSEAGAFNLQTDFDVEIHFKVHATAGDVEVRINGVSVVHAINVDTQPGANAYFDAICFGWSCINNAPVTPACSFDNLRHYDTAGPLNNTWLGTCRVQTCMAAGNGSTTDFTRSNTGLANWQNIANQVVDDTLYLSDGAIGDFNLSTIQPLVNSPVVDFIGVLTFMRQDDATQITAKNRIVSAGVTLDGAAFNTSESYTGDLDILETDPATGVQFTGAGVNALQIGPLFVTHA